MANNDRRARVRERLAYLFGGALIGELFLILIARMMGIEVPVPEAIGIVGILGTIIGFYFGGEASREKPES